MWHEELSRGSASRLLNAVLGPTGSIKARQFDPAVEAEIADLHHTVQPLVRSLIGKGAPVPVVGYEIEREGAGLAWMVEAAWPASKVAILLDADSARDHRLNKTGWTALPLQQWTEEALYLAVVGKA